MIDSRLHRFELFGEATLLSVLDLLVASSNPLVTPDAREIIGWMMIVSIATPIVVVVGLSAFESFVNTKLKLRRFCHERRIKKILASRRSKALEESDAAMKDSVALPKRNLMQLKSLSVISEEAESNRQLSRDRNVRRFDDESLAVLPSNNLDTALQIKVAEETKPEECTACRILGRRCLVCQFT